MKIIPKEFILCFLFIVVNLLYLLLIMIELDVFAGKFNFEILYIPGLLFGFLIFPVANFILWKVRGQIGWIDYTLIIVPLLLWLLIIPGGSFTNFLFMNFPLIWTVSLLYLLRFSCVIKDKNVYVVALFLWILIAVVSFGINYSIPILPE